MNLYKSDKRILFFAEDPGAANYIAPLALLLSSKRIDVSIRSAGKAIEIFNQMNSQHKAVDNGETAKYITTDYNPDLIIVGTSENPDTIGLSLISEAKNSDTKSIGVIDAPAFSEYRFRGREENPLAHSPDWLLVPDKFTMQLYANLGFPAERIKAFGHPHFEQMLAKSMALLGCGQAKLRNKIFGDIPNKHPIILFISEISDGFQKEDFQYLKADNLYGRGGSRERTKIVLEEVLDALKEISPAPFFVLRLAPKDQANEFEAYLNEIDKISSDGPILPLLCAADIVIGLTSMPIYEAALLGKPTISILPNPEQRHWLPSIELGLTELAVTRGEVREKILQGLNPRTTRRAHEDAILHRPEGVTDQILSFIKDL